jgi:LemA protein
MVGGKKSCLTYFVIVGVLVLFLSYPTIKEIYNQLAALDAGVKMAWPKLEDQLQRRMDLIPNYMEIMKSHAPQEQEVFGVVTQLHVRVAVTMLRSNKIALNNDLAAALNRLGVVTDRYPDLMADQTFILLQDELADIKARITEECTRYNEAVREYNACREGFPADIVAPFSGFGKAFPLETPGKVQGLKKASSEPYPPSSGDQ